MKYKNLLTIKSIVTLVLTLVFSVLALKGDIQVEQVVQVFTIVIGFYFGTQKVSEGYDE